MRTSTYSKEYLAIRKWLKAKREEKGLSLRDASQLVGRHHSVLGKMEQERRKIDLIEFVQYCETLGLDPKEGIEIIQDQLRKAPKTKRSG